MDIFYNNLFNIMSGVLHFEPLCVYNKNIGLLKQKLWYNYSEKIKEALRGGETKQQRKIVAKKYFCDCAFKIIFAYKKCLRI